MRTQLTGAVVPREDVPHADVDRLHRLFVRHYSHVDRETFYRDWEEKDWALLLRDQGGVLRGFTTMVLMNVELERDGRPTPICALFNGNTIIEPRYWGEQTLARTWGEFMARLKIEQPDTPLYWYLISSGFRTYLYLPLFFREFYPAWNRETPPFEQRLIDTLGRLKYPREYRDGIVRVDSRRECLRPSLAEASGGRRRNPHVRFFLERNPGFERGDELVCVAEFSLENNRRLARECLLGAMETSAAC